MVTDHNVTSKYPTRLQIGSGYNHLPNKCMNQKQTRHGNTQNREKTERETDKKKQSELHEMNANAQL